MGFCANLCAILLMSSAYRIRMRLYKWRFDVSPRPLQKRLILLTKFAAYMIGTVAIIGVSHLLSDWHYGNASETERTGVCISDENFGTHAQ